MFDWMLEVACSPMGPGFAARSIVRVLLVLNCRLQDKKF